MNVQDRTPWYERLRQERIKHNWRQRDVAEQIGTTTITITRWEQGNQLPSIYFRARLCALFGKSAQELGFLQDPVSPQEQERNEPARIVATLTPDEERLWQVPYPRNPFFTGREDLLQYLHEQLHREHTVALTQSWAISGLGGIGKTQTVLEYAYRFASDYHAVFWVTAANRETLLSGFVSLATLLQLPERDEMDQVKIVAGVKQWLQQHPRWLLILDNADDLSLLTDFLPALREGHLLLTTRAQASGGLARRIEVRALDQASGSLLLLRRSTLLASYKTLDQATEADRLGARELWHELAGLPLALDQAGAYLEETGCGLPDYLDLFRTQRGVLLRQRGGVLRDHPDSVYTTFTLAINAVVQQDAVVLDLLRACALLYPEAIPEELFCRGAAHLGTALPGVCTDLLAWNKLVAVACSYSLLQRQGGEQTLSIHRLVQAVLLDGMSEQEHELWIRRVIMALNTVFPKSEHATWKACERLISHVLTVIEPIRPWQLDFQEMAELLDKAAGYLNDRAQYEQAELLYQRGLAIWEQILGPENARVAVSLCTLAELYAEQGRYAEAEPLYLRSLHIHEQELGTEHIALSSSLNGLANLYYLRGRYAEAEPLYRRSLRIRERELGAEHADLASPLNGLASVYSEQGKYAEAEPLYRRSLSIREQAMGSEHPDVAYPLTNMALFYYQQKNYAEAEACYLRAASIWEKALGPDHPRVAYPLNGLAVLYEDQERYAEAEPLYLRVLHMREQALGPDHPQVFYPLNGLANLYTTQGMYEKAEPLHQRSLQICEQALGPQHPDTADPLHDFARLRAAQGRYDEAIAFYKRALAIRERAFEPDHPKVSDTREHLRALLLTTGHAEEASHLKES